MAQQGSTLLKRLTAFIGLWLLGVAALAIIAYAIKLVIL